MRKKHTAILAGALGVLTAWQALALGAEDLGRIENFRLIDQHDVSHELYRLDEAAAVVLYVHGNGCPIVRQSYGLLNEIRDDYAEQGVAFLMINPNTQDTRAEVREELEEFGASAFTVLLDQAQTVTQGLGVERMAEVLLIDPKNDWRIVYRGAVDDRFEYGATRPAPEHTWLRDALDAHLAGKPIGTPRAPVKGCRIHYLIPEEISFARDVAPIIAEKCMTCHVSGGIGPFRLDSHRRVRGWGEMIRETVLTRRMPPWHADPHYEVFSNNIGLSPEEERILLTWIARGAELGDEADPLPDLAPLKDEWALGEPDVVVQLPEEQHLPATGIVDYRYIYVPVELTEDRWVRALDVRPTNLAVVHHALIFIVYPPEFRHIQPDMRSGLGGYFAAYLPGGEVQPFPDGSGQFVPKGSTFIFQMHYSTTGKEETDQTRMGLYFHDETPEKEFRIRAANFNDFRIPPNVQDHPARATYNFRHEADLWGASPHMHFRGGRFRYDAHFPDGEVRTLLNVPFYEFDWQPLYMLAEPVPIPAETRVVCDGAFDNSRYNPRNPNPNAMVFFGEQSHEEMFIGYLAMTLPMDPERFLPREVSADAPALTRETLIGSKWYVTRNIMLRFDEDGSVWGNDYLRGDWELRDNVITITSRTFNLELLMQGPDLVFRGRALRRAE